MTDQETTVDAEGLHQMVADPYAYWNTPDGDGLTRRQRKWADRAGVPASLTAIAVEPCLGGRWGDGPVCIDGSCVTCEARRRLRNRKGTS